MKTEQIAKAINSAEILLQDLKILNNPPDIRIMRMMQDTETAKNKLRTLLIKVATHVG